MRSWAARSWAVRSEVRCLGAAAQLVDQLVEGIVGQLQAVQVAEELLLHRAEPAAQLLLRAWTRCDGGLMATG